MTKTATTTEYTIDHLITAVDIITDANIPGYIQSTVIRDRLMAMGLDMPTATTIECAATVITDLGIDL